MLKTELIKIIKEIQYHSPLRRYFFPRYGFNFTAAQLCFLCRCIEETRNVPGDIAEVGCANGITTLFLKNYLDAQRIVKKYYAIDTFSGFVEDDVDFEASHRKKDRNWYKGFQVNKKKWFDDTMRQNKVDGVHSIQADVNEYDLRTLEPLAFVLLDVDLYRPMRKCLKSLYSVLSPGGILVADDCDPSHPQWDGAHQAYEEFIKEIEQSGRIVHEKLGVIRKAAVCRPELLSKTQ